MFRTSYGVPRAFISLWFAWFSACTALESGSALIEPAAPGEGDATTVDERDPAPLDAGTDEDPPDTDAATDDSDQGCEDPRGFAGLGCYRCAPTDLATLERRCSEASCTPFDNAALLTGLLADGGLPALPPAGEAPGPTADASAPVAPPDTDCAAIVGAAAAVYVTGSTAARPFLQLLGPQLATRGVVMIYTSTGSCTGVDAVLNGTPMKTGDAPLPAFATYWESATSAGKPCRLPDEGVSADLAISDVFAQSCPGFSLVDLDALRVRDAHGPVQTMTFAVPANSKHAAISAQAAYLVFGLGAAGGVSDGSGAPAWADETLLFPRSASSGTQVLLSAAIGLPPDAWRGAPHASSDDVARELLLSAASQTTADGALGIIGADYLQIRNLRSQIRALAFQDTGQACAMYPDSTSTARDKRNVRDGHYPLWGPLHLLHRTDAQGNPLRAESREAVADIVRYLSGTKALPNGLALIDLYAESGLVPECAMEVSRSSDGGNIVPTQAELPCACLFELKATGATRCTSCRVQGDCGTGQTCSLGYCEPGAR